LEIKGRRGKHKRKKKSTLKSPGSPETLRESSGGKDPKLRWRESNGVLKDELRFKEGTCGY